MTLTEQNSPLAASEAEQVNRLVECLDGRQRDWLSGYLSGLSAAGATAPSSASQPEAGGPELTILYGSQTGNSEGVAEDLAARASQKGIVAKSVDMADYKPRQLKNEAFVAMVASTHGEGDPPDNALDFYEFLHGRKAPKLGQVQYAVLSLGDESYEHFCQTGKDLDARFSALGAQPLTERVDCDVDYEDDAERWMEAVLAAMPSTTAAGGAGQAAPGVPATTASSKYTRKNPFAAEILENQLLNGRGTNKEVRHIELSLEESGLEYQPGDALGIYPKNEPALVEAVIDQLSLDSQATVTVDDQSMTLAEALLSQRDITVLTKSLLAQWQAYVEDDAFTAMAESPDARREWMRGRDLLDLAQAWPPNALDAQSLVDMLRRLAPRMYSIASSQRAVDEEVHVTVAAVRYREHDRDRLGVASTWLSDRVDDDATIPVFIDPNKNFALPEDDATPIIMIGPGTGVAPFRAFLQEREERGADGLNWLIFGDQHMRSDFLYQSEWLDWRRDGVLSRLDVAFSRDQAEKRYVQHVLRENAADVWQWLEKGAAVYVCGDADNMAPDVNEALIDIIASQGGQAREAAQDYLRQLSREKRYQRDVY